MKILSCLLLRCKTQDAPEKILSPVLLEYLPENLSYSREINVLFGLEKCWISKYDKIKQCRVSTFLFEDRF